jgi:hypothetical protein
VKTFGALVSPDTFCRFYELHPQGWKISFEGEDEVFYAQSGCCTFVPQRNNKVLKLDHVEISFSQKNKWDDDWTGYWLYAKIGFVNSSQEEIFSLALKVLPFQHINQADVDRSSKDLKDCCTAFREVAKAIGSRDLVEEYLAAKIWLLTPQLGSQIFFEGYGGQHI